MVVCDGFVGNVILKTCESLAHAIGVWMKQEFKANPFRMVAALCLKGAFADMKKKVDPSAYGGARCWESTGSASSGTARPTRRPCTAASGFPRRPFHGLNHAISDVLAAWPLVQAQGAVTAG